jgi:hypothetical protein
MVTRAQSTANKYWMSEFTGFGFVDSTAVLGLILFSCDRGEETCENAENAAALADHCDEQNCEDQ